MLPSSGLGPHQDTSCHMVGTLSASGLHLPLPPPRNYSAKARSSACMSPLALPLYLVADWTATCLQLTSIEKVQ